MQIKIFFINHYLIKVEFKLTQRSRMAHKTFSQFLHTFYVITQDTRRPDCWAGVTSEPSGVICTKPNA